MIYWGLLNWMESSCAHSQIVLLSVSISLADEEPITLKWLFSVFSTILLLTYAGYKYGAYGTRVLSTGNAFPGNRRPVPWTLLFFLAPTRSTRSLQACTITKLVTAATPI